MKRTKKEKQPMTKQEKNNKKFYRNKWFWIVMGIVLVSVIFYPTDDTDLLDDNQDQQEEQAEEQAQEDEEKAKEEAAKEKEEAEEKAKKEQEKQEKAERKKYKDMPVIAGSNAYDVTIEAEKFGIRNKDRTVRTEDDVKYIDNTTVYYGYSMQAGDDQQIGYAEFYVYRANEEDDGGLSFLRFCSTLPYDKSNTDKAASWVKKNYKKSHAKTTIGDAVFELTTSSNKHLRQLTIKAKGYDKYLEYKLDEELE